MDHFSYFGEKKPCIQTDDFKRLFCVAHTNRFHFFKNKKIAYMVYYFARLYMKIADKRVQSNFSPSLKMHIKLYSFEDQKSQ